LGSEQEVTLLYAYGSRNMNTAICLRDYLHRRTTRTRTQPSGDNP
jgi:uncharacterized protein YeaO (DUF488 family)